jgi:hypothetical protein
MPSNTEPVKTQAIRKYIEAETDQNNLSSELPIPTTALSQIMKKE